MIRTKSSEARVTSRSNAGDLATKFKIAVVQKKLIRPNAYEFCDLIDIGQGGIGIASQWLDAKMGQRLHLEIHYGRKKYSARGIVTRISTEDKFDYYGIAFIYAPPELDRLIDLFMKAHPARTEAAGLEPPKKTPRGKRITMQDAQVYAKKADASDPLFLCEVDNLSNTGMGFYCASKIDKKTPFALTVQISLPPNAAQITGTVHHVSKRLDTYYYGMEFELVSVEFARLLQDLH